tara:strand:+ start:471 stop:704 length:234 start_codon:yes stop_codon:yes gene_type:complete
MKILVQVLRSKRDNSYNDKMVYVVDNSLTQETTDIENAITKSGELKLKFQDSQIRIIEYHNDESDKDRKPCKIIQLE